MAFWVFAIFILFMGLSLHMYFPIILGIIAAIIKIHFDDEIL